MRSFYPEELVARRDSSPGYPERVLICPAPERAAERLWVFAPWRAEFSSERAFESQICNQPIARGQQRGC